MIRELRQQKERWEMIEMAVSATVVIILVLGVAMGAGIVALCAPWPFKERDRVLVERIEAERDLINEMRARYTAKEEIRP